MIFAFVVALYGFLVWPIHKEQWQAWRAKRNAVKQRKVLVEEAEEYLRSKH